MIFLSWAAYYEGSSDRSYYDVLLPRVMEEITLAEATQQVTIATTPVVALGRYGRAVNEVAREICANKDQMHLLFVHADTGGRQVARSLPGRSSAYCEEVQNQCNWDLARCVTLTPRRETEAWVLADPKAVTAALSFRGTPDSLGLPRNGAAAEALLDPKAVLESAIRAVLGRGRRRAGSLLFTAVAQTQTLGALRGCSSFQTFEKNLRRALSTLGCIVAV